MAIPQGRYFMDGLYMGNGYGVEDTPYVILEDGDSTGPMKIRTQDFEAARSDTLLFGRDYFTPPERNLTVGIRTSDRMALATLRSAWRADGVRSTPGAWSILRWNNDGRSFRAYGRPREFEVLGQSVHDPDWTVVNLSFQYRDAFVLEDDENHVSLNTLNAGATGEGLILPAVLPWSLGTSSVERTGIVNLVATAPVHFEVEITGPVSGSATNFLVYGRKWTLDFGSTSLRPGEKIRVNTLAGYALKDGKSIAGNLSRGSSLTARLQPGPNPFTFTANDDTGTATATISWYNAAPII